MLNNDMKESLLDNTNQINKNNSNNINEQFNYDELIDNLNDDEIKIVDDVVFESAKLRFNRNNKIPNVLDDISINADLQDKISIKLNDKYKCKSKLNNEHNFLSSNNYDGHSNYTDINSNKINLCLNSNNIKENLNNNENCIINLDLSHNTNNTDNNIIINPNESLYLYIYKIMVTSFPVSLGLLFTILVESINIMFVGRLNKPVLLASVGLGTCFITILGNKPILGIQGAIDSLCSAASGGKQYKLVNYYTNISRLVTFCFCLFIFLPASLFSNYIIKLLGQSEEITNLTSSFIKSMILAIFFVGQREVLIRYLQSMLIFTPIMIISLITLIVHPFWAYLFIIKLNYSLKGAGYSLIITQLTNILLLSIYIHFSKNKKVIKSNPNKLSFISINYIKTAFNLKYIKNFLFLAIPSIVVNAIEDFAFEILIIISSFIGVAEMSSTICLFNIGFIAFVLYNGIAISTGSYVGNCVGLGNASLLQRYIKSGLLYVFIIASLYITIFYFFKRQIILLYTSNEEVIYYFDLIAPYYNIFVFIDCFGVLYGGIIKGLGRQKKAMKYLLILMYLISTPTSIIFVFVLNLGVIGLWQSQMIFVLFYFFVMFYIYKSKDVEYTIKEYEAKTKNMYRII